MKNYPSLQDFNNMKKALEDSREIRKRLKEENEKLKQVYDKVIDFMRTQDITCEEAIYQCDRVIENAYEFIEDLFNLVKEDLDLESEEE